MFSRLRTLHSEPRPDPEWKQTYLTGFSLVLLFFAVCLTSIQVILSMSVMGTAIPAITTYFGTVEDVDWYGTAYLLSLCAIQPLTGQVYTIFRIKAVFITFIFLFEVGLLVSALAKTSEAFIVGRAISGLGGAGLFNGCMVIITAAVPPHLRAQFLSMSMVMVGVGGVLGPVMGGAITQHLGWRWCLWVFLPPATVTALIFLVLRVSEQLPKAPALSILPRLHQHLDFIGFSLFTPACVMFLLAMSWGGSKLPWNSGTVIALLIASSVTIIIFAAWTRHYKERSMIPPAILLKPVVLYGCIASFLQGGAFMMVQFYLPIWFQSVQGANPEKGGIMMLPTCITQIIASAICTILLKTIPFAPVWAIFGNVASAIGSGLMVTFMPSTSSGKWIGFQILRGVGIGVTVQMPILAAQSILPPTEIAHATANMLFFQYFGGAVANCIAKTVFINSLGPAIEQYAPNVDPEKVIHVGATQVFRTIGSEDRAGVVLAYNKALTSTFWLPTAFACVACVVGLGLGWHKLDVKKDRDTRPDDATSKSAPEAINIAMDGEKLRTSITSG